MPLTGVAASANPIAPFVTEPKGGSTVAHNNNLLPLIFNDEDDEMDDTPPPTTTVVAPRPRPVRPLEIRDVQLTPPHIDESEEDELQMDVDQPDSAHRAQSSKRANRSSPEGQPKKKKRATELPAGFSAAEKGKGVARASESSARPSTSRLSRVPPLPKELGGNQLKPRRSQRVASRSP